MHLRVRYIPGINERKPEKNSAQIAIEIETKREEKWSGKHKD